MSVTSGWGRLTWNQANWNEAVTLKTGWGAQSWSVKVVGVIFLTKQFH